jgi:hypothetical protein
LHLQLLVHLFIEQVVVVVVQMLVMVLVAVMAVAVTEAVAVHLQQLVQRIQVVAVELDLVQHQVPVVLGW